MPMKLRVRAKKQGSKKDLEAQLGRLTVYAGAMVI